MSKTKAKPRRKLNLGSGEDYREGWHNVDVDGSVSPDQQLDLEDTPWDLPDDHYSVVECRHVLEHLETVPWDELARILQPNGSFCWTYPIGHTRFEDVTHKQFWNWHTADQLTGARKHGHETDHPFSLVRRNLEWDIGDSEPLAELYTRYRLWLKGPGPWLSQVPGLYGEVTAVYRYAP